MVCIRFCFQGDEIELIKEDTLRFHELDVLSSGKGNACSLILWYNFDIMVQL